MLNLQFAETMELTEAELRDVYGGNFGKFYHSWCLRWYSSLGRITNLH